MDLPKLAIAALGGTVSMQASNAAEGVIPTVSGEILLASVPELTTLARVTVETLGLLPSASLDFEFLLSVLAWANFQVKQGAAGVVITQGTDTLEETATFFDYLWDHDEPLVLTGAMRSANQAGADGPANLLDACRVALAENSRQRGVHVVMNGQIHSANAVRKTDSLALQAFSSPIVGPAGMLMENTVNYLRLPVQRRVLPLPQQTTQKIALLEASLGANTLLLENILELGYDGLVIAGFGAGHVCASWAEVIETIARKIPVIVATRTGSGSTAQSTYGFIGSEMDLIRKGASMAGFLCPRKTRILLWLLIGCQQQDELARFLVQN
ncbi:MULTISPECIES: asparaginase [Gammaproteobacteria]|uniref:asparaginase n=1 Tax=Gammaproteobacteria TaxID=1236 RepID=UPI001912CF7A|nr:MULTISPECIES: asparaginase [Gammaproteobacteria]MBK5304247.1 asparaginase [Bacillus sp. TH86]MBK5324016.1 asparaginase [Bacillus sp. TH59]MBK5338966.1 asparaginase [Bacillus sp. TH57]MBK5318514.1 asparaginase [Erwinia sp. TH79]MBK5423374.1 asparaginase [Erwinia sp. TH29]